MFQMYTDATVITEIPKSFQSVTALIYLFTIMHVLKQQLLTPLPCRNLWFCFFQKRVHIVKYVWKPAIIWRNCLQEDTAQSNAEEMTEWGPGLGSSPRCPSPWHWPAYHSNCPWIQRGPKERWGPYLRGGFFLK